jgi:hypothetical protein
MKADERQYVWEEGTLSNVMHEVPLTYEWYYPLSPLSK